MTEFDFKCFELSRKIHRQELTFELCAGAGCSVDGRNRPGKTEPLVLRPALFPSGALLEDFNDRILLQELSMKSADPKRRTHTHDEFEKRSGCKIESWRSGAVEKGTCSSSPGVCDWAGCH